MMAIYIQDDDAVDYTPAAAVPSGTVVVQGALIGIATRPIPANTLGSLLVEGLFDLPVAPGGAAPTGTPVFWNPATSLAVLDGTIPGAVYAGVAVRPLAAADSVLRTRLNHPR